MKHIGLFEGIGGFSLAARWAGWETVAWCEIDSFCQKVLSYHFPESQQHGDIKTTDFSIYRGKCDILTGGFPCQPYSAAGKRLGKNDDRHLWPEMLRAIREIQPIWIVGENVRGLTNWNGGVVFDEVQADLEALGYEVQSFILPACAVNAPHRRDRVWIVAYSEREACSKRNDRWAKHKPNDRQSLRVVDNEGGKITPNAHSNKRRERGMHSPECEISERHVGTCDARTDELPAWDNFPTQSPICGRNDGLSERLDGITFPKWRNESIKAYGNAIVPQVAYEIFKVINQMAQ